MGNKAKTERKQNLQRSVPVPNKTAKSMLDKEKAPRKRIGTQKMMR